MQTQLPNPEVSETKSKSRLKSPVRRRPGLQKPRVGNGTFEDLLAVVATFEAITDEDVDRLNETITEERRIRRLTSTL